jgi:hypothetical protein
MILKFVIPAPIPGQALGAGVEMSAMQERKASLVAQRAACYGFGHAASIRSLMNVR